MKSKEKNCYFENKKCLKKKLNKLIKKKITKTSDLYKNKKNKKTNIENL